MILERLREETKTAHQNLEKILIPNIKSIQNNADYVKLLKAFYGYMRPVEHLIDQHVNKARIPHYDKRRKVGAILEDIKTMNGDNSNDESELLPEIKNEHEAIGAMYVFEGSTLGGKVISKMIAQALQLENMDGLTFFGGYGPDTGMMWSSFTEVLDKYSDDPKAQDEIVNGANQTFSHFKTWIEQQFAVA